jgi:predicted nucleic acid-binding protein
MITTINATPYLFDASSLIKLVIPEEGYEEVRNCFDNNRLWNWSTNICYAEALSELKLKHRYQEITRVDYIYACDILTSHVRQRRMKILDIELRQANVWRETERLAREHDIDLTDALQLTALKSGPIDWYADQAKATLVTANENLHQAAAKEGLRSWLCVNARALV